MAAALVQSYFFLGLLLQSLHCFAWTHNFNAELFRGTNEVPIRRGHLADCCGVLQADAL
jgi:hypothetical protein